MPRGDRTGPYGQGPMTGRATGYCTGYSMPGYMNPTPGFGRGRRRGFGRGWGRGFGRGWRSYSQQSQMPYPPREYPQVVPSQTVQPSSPEQEAALLENYKKELEAEKADLEQEMDRISSKIKELKEEPEK